jgi:hypothetical protein
MFADNLVGDFAGAETFLAYMRPSAEPGYNWVKPELTRRWTWRRRCPTRPAATGAGKGREDPARRLIFAPIAKGTLPAPSGKAEGQGLWETSVADYTTRSS